MMISPAPDATSGVIPGIRSAQKVIRSRARDWTTSAGTAWARSRDTALQVSSSHPNFWSSVCEHLHPILLFVFSVRVQSRLQFVCGIEDAREPLC